MVDALALTCPFGDYFKARGILYMSIWTLNVRGFTVLRAQSQP